MKEIQIKSPFLLRQMGKKTKKIKKKTPKTNQTKKQPWVIGKMMCFEKKQHQNLPWKIKIIFQMSLIFLCSPLSWPFWNHKWNCKTSEKKKKQFFKADIQFISNISLETFPFSFTDMKTFQKLIHTWNDKFSGKKRRLRLISPIYSWEFSFFKYYKRGKLNIRE